MKLLYKKEKYKKFNRHKIAKLTRIRKKRKLKIKKYKKELDKHSKLLSRKDSIIRFPRELFLEKNNGEDIFALIEGALNKEYAILDFSDTKCVDIGSMCYIRAFVDYLQYIGKKYCIECLYKNRKMRQILQHVGIKDYKFANITYADIKCWYVRAWKKHCNEVNIGKEIMEKILPRVLENRIPSSEFENITPSLIEILSNCAEHAYLDDDEYNNYYLIAGEYENANHKRSGTFAFSIVDLGQGFRSSLEKKHSLFKSDEDSKLLEGAINGKLTSKIGGGKDSGRGTGLLSVLDYIKDIGGSLHAYSDKGFYKLYRLDDGQKDTFSRDRKTKMKGSIIEIGLPISNKG